ncbi:MAG: hypothetical protein Q9197_004384 [Variospora fuerteventurae]
MPPLVYIDGHPDEERACIASELCLDNLAAIVLSGSDQQLLPLHPTLTQDLFKAIVASKSTQQIGWIFVKPKSSNTATLLSVTDYHEAARLRDVLLISVCLRRNPERNGEVDSVKRNSDTQHSLSKLSTVSSHWIEVGIEVSGLSSRRVAETIREHLSKATADENFTTKSSVEPVKALAERRFADIEGFKHVFVRDLLDGPPDRDIHILCWLKSRPRDLSAMLFLPVCDSTGTIQVVVEKSKISYWAEIRAWKAESSMIISGTVQACRGSREIVAQEVAIVSRSNRLLHPEIRKLDRELLANYNTDSLLASRHLYLRNPLLVALNSYRSKFMFCIHQWFRDHQFVDFSAPLITPSLLYESRLRFISPI